MENRGQTTSTDPRSKRTWTSRRGGQRKARARSPSRKTACPACVLPKAPVPVTRPYGPSPRTATSETIFMPRKARAGLPGGRVFGPTHIGKDGELYAEGATFYGPIRSAQARRRSRSATSAVLGSVNVTETTGPVMIGSPETGACGGNFIQGALERRTQRVCDLRRRREGHGRHRHRGRHRPRPAALDRQRRRVRGRHLHPEQRLRTDHTNEGNS